MAEYEARYYELIDALGAGRISHAAALRLCGFARVAREDARAPNITVSLMSIERQVHHHRPAIAAADD